MTPPPISVYSQRDQKIGGYQFVLTCRGFPEQYDVFTETGREVGYVRLRYGSLSVCYPDVEGIEVYAAETGWGYFDSDEDRTLHLTAAAKAIEKADQEAKHAQ